VIVVLLGPPGSGKGTQAALLARRAGIPQISTGEMLRRSVAEGSDLGRRAGEIMKAGALVPDDVMIGVIRQRIAAEDCRDGFLLDGFPRTIGQAEALERLLSESGRRLDVAVNLSVDEPLLVERMAGRAAAEGRADDDPATVRERLRVYREKTAPLVEWYRRRSVLRELDGAGSIEEVGRRMDAVLGEVRVR
jgi:adenylate kinase